MLSESPLFVGDSPAAAALRRAIADAARTDATVLIVGETGAGKELVARTIHLQSARRHGPLVTVHCSGIPEMLLESELFGHVKGSFTGAYRDHVGVVRHADRGTLFLDQVGDTSLRMQAVLLRFTETGEIQPVGAESVVGRTDVRLIAATNGDLQARVWDGAFREDLYYRLNVIQIAVPPLRDRKEDIIVLLRRFLADTSAAHALRCPTLTPPAEQVVVQYAWPGNVRELKNVAERLVVTHPGQLLTPEDLLDAVRASSPPTSGSEHRPTLTQRRSRIAFGTAAGQ